MYDATHPTNPPISPERQEPVEVLEYCMSDDGLSSGEKFKFRWRRGYTGPTAQTYNKNYKKMPKDF